MLEPETVRQVWIATLVVYGIVLGVVAVLLALILGTARRIRETVGAIWTVGQKIAGNTIHLALLDTVNHVVAQIAEAARRVAAATAALPAHAEGGRGPARFGDPGAGR